MKKNIRIKSLPKHSKSKQRKTYKQAQIFKIYNVNGIKSQCKKNNKALFNKSNSIIQFAKTKYEKKQRIISYQQWKNFNRLLIKGMGQNSMVEVKGAWKDIKQKIVVREWGREGLVDKIEELLEKELRDLNKVQRNRMYQQLLRNVILVISELGDSVISMRCSNGQTIAILSPNTKNMSKNQILLQFIKLLQFPINENHLVYIQRLMQQKQISVSSLSESDLLENQKQSDIVTNNLLIKNNVSKENLKSNKKQNKQNSPHQNYFLKTGLNQSFHKTFKLSKQQFYHKKVHLLGINSLSSLFKDFSVILSMRKQLIKTHKNNFIQFIDSYPFPQKRIIYTISQNLKKILQTISVNNIFYDLESNLFYQFIGVLEKKTSISNIQKYLSNIKIVNTFIKYYTDIPLFTLSFKHKSTIFEINVTNKFNWNLIQKQIKLVAQEKDSEYLINMLNNHAQLIDSYCYSFNMIGFLKQILELEGKTKYQQITMLKRKLEEIASINII